MNFNESGSQEPRENRRRAIHVAQWFYRRRYIAALNALRGASYAAGTSVVGLIAWWFENPLLSVSMPTGPSVSKRRARCCPDHSDGGQQPCLRGRRAPLLRPLGAAWSIDNGYSYAASGRQDWPGESCFSSARPAAGWTRRPALPPARWRLTQLRRRAPATARGFRKPLASRPSTRSPDAWHLVLRRYDRPAGEEIGPTEGPAA